MACVTNPITAFYLRNSAILSHIQGRKRFGNHSVKQNVEEENKKLDILDKLLIGLEQSDCPDSRTELRQNRLFPTVGVHDTKVQAVPILCTPDSVPFADHAVGLSEQRSVSRLRCNWNPDQQENPRQHNHSGQRGNSCQQKRQNVQVEKLAELANSESGENRAKRQGFAENSRVSENEQEQRQSRKTGPMSPNGMSQDLLTGCPAQQPDFVPNLVHNLVPNPSRFRPPSSPFRMNIGPCKARMPHNVVASLYSSVK